MAGICEIQKKNKPTWHGSLWLQGAMFKCPQSRCKHLKLEKLTGMSLHRMHPLRFHYKKTFSSQNRRKAYVRSHAHAPYLAKESNPRRTPSRQCGSSCKATVSFPKLLPGKVLWFQPMLWSWLVTLSASGTSSKQAKSKTIRCDKK